MKNLLYIIPLFMISCAGEQKSSDAYGTFEAVEVTVSSQSSGPIVNLAVSEGDIVESGDFLAQIDTLQMHFQREQIRSQMLANVARTASTRSQSEVVTEQLLVAKKEQNRVQNLVKDGAATQKMLDDVNGQISVLEKQRSQVLSQLGLIEAERGVQSAQLAQIEDAISRAHVRAPISGAVLLILAEQGELALPGKPMLILADTESMIVKAYVGAEQLPSITRGQQVRVFIDKDKASFTELDGRISWISPKAEFTPKIIQTKDERTNLVYAIKVAVKNNGHLFVGMPAEIQLLSVDVVAQR